MKRFFLYFLLISGGALSCLHAQTLSGKIVSEQNLPAQSVHLKWKKPGLEVITLADGKFSMLPHQLPDTLVLSGANYETYKVLITAEVAQKGSLEVVMLKKRVQTLMAPSISTEEAGGGDEWGFGDEGGFDDAGGESATNESHGDEWGFGDTYDVEEPVKKLPDVNLYSAQDVTQIKPIKAKARLLTAMEVNDLQKWDMWKDFTGNEFKQFVQTWTFTPSNRYTVQLLNKYYEPLIDEPVELQNNIGQTLWKARTDNTGKAELWATFSSNSPQTLSDLVIIGEGFRLENPKPFKSGVNAIQTPKSCNTTSGIDISFVMDASGSMDDELDFLKMEMENIIGKTIEKYSQNADLRVSALFYQDEKTPLRSLDFGTDLLQISNFIKLQGIEGGEEPVHRAIETALQFTWRKEAKTRIMFLIGDEPPSTQHAVKMAELCQLAAEKGVRIVPLACSGTDRSTEYLFRAMSLATNGTYISLTDDSGIGNYHQAPLTDSHSVEFLSELLERVIGQYSYKNDCQSPVDESNTKVPTMPFAAQEEMFKIYPNPTQGILNIECNETIVEMYLADYTGKIIEKIPFDAGNTSLIYDISQYPSGIYLLRYLDKAQKQWAKKVILQH